MGLSPKEKMDYFLGSLTSTNKTYDYFVDFDKVKNNIAEIEIGLHTMNYLIGKDDIREEARKLFTSQPHLIRIIPMLLATRDTTIELIVFDDKDRIKKKSLDFNNPKVKNIDDYLDLMENTGLLDFIQNSTSKSLVDVMYGIEIGLDSNTRKNRSGKIMEGIVKDELEKSLTSSKYEIKEQANVKWIKENWDIDIPSDKSSRRFDFAVYNKKTKKVHLIETNFYSSPGSKLKSVSGEFIGLQTLLKENVDNVTFSWITDGNGWKTSKTFLQEGFNEIDNIFNINMLKSGYLLNILK